MSDKPQVLLHHHLKKLRLLTFQSEYAKLARQRADRFGVHRTTVRRWVHSDPSFPKPVKLGPGSTRWKLEDIELWEAAGAAASA